MRIATALLLACVPVLAAHGQSSVGPTQSDQPFSIVISPAKASTKTGAEIMIKVKLLNTSTHPVNGSGVWDEGLNLTYGYDIRDASGHPCARSDRAMEHGRTMIHTLAPGDTFDENIWIDRYYDLKTPGTYTVQLSRAASSNPADGFIKSNVITIVVTP